jgi:hypothetical protein
VPDLILKKTGKPVYVADEALADAVASQLYETPAGNQAVNVEVRPGVVGTTKLDSLGAAQAGGATVESEGSFRGRERTARIDREQGGVIGTIKTGVETALDEGSVGIFGALGEAIGGEEYTERRLERQEANPLVHGIAKVGTIVGTTIASGGLGAAGKAARATPLGAITHLGERIAKSGVNVGKASRAARIGLGGAVEGGLTGVGQGVQELVATDEPLTVERIASTLGGNVGSGVLIGGGANLAVAGAGKALRVAKKSLDNLASRTAKESAEVADNLAGMDAKQLRQAQKAEVGRIKSEVDVAHKQELDAIETARAPKREELVGSLKAHRETLKEEKIWLATKDLDAKAVGNVGEISKISYDADKSIRSMLNNPKHLAQNPGRALEALQRQENALEMLAKNEPELRSLFAADKSGTRAASLDAIPTAIERNRALQAQVRELAAKPSSARLVEIEGLKATPSSAHLDEIAAARDALSTRGQKGFGQQIAQGAVYSGVTGAVAALPIPGSSFIAPLIGGKAANFVSEKLMGALGKSAHEAAKRTSAAVGAFLDVGGKIAPAAPVLATKALGGVSYDASAPKKRPAKSESRPTRLAELYKARSGEIRQQTAYAQGGRSTMTRAARESVAAHFAPIAALDPILADRLESQVVRGREFLANKLPRRPDMGIMQIGPDDWQPSDMEMRSWARSVAAVEDPGGIEERLTDGSLTPEDAEVMREVYPERYADIVRQIVEKLPDLQESLPYHRRLALSMFADVPVDLSMHPEVLAVLQGGFVNEEGTEGGTQAPVAKPAFGSVRNQDATPSQRRQGAV